VKRYIRNRPRGRRIVANATVEHIARHAKIVDGMYDQAGTTEAVMKSDLQPVAKAFVQIVDGLSRTPSADIAARRRE
jgi:hypothetical protein